MDKDHFQHLFWFCVGVFIVSFIAMLALIFVPYPSDHRDMAFSTQGFLQGSLIMSAVGFLLTGNITPQSKKNEQKTTTEFTPEGSTTITTEPVKPLQDEK